ncbi:MAG: hypothetical protein DRQ02_03920 [Candidatus Latescibacterota bacterium]|nr:MAG: hypothetical protein DRQ02_03920 [Candidatus Latescibacterota bacterium]
MKKSIVVFLMSVFLLSYAAQALASSEAEENPKKIDVSGKIIYRGRWYNLDFNDDSDRGSLNRKNYYGDITLTMKFQPIENVSGCFQFYKQVYGTGLAQYNTIQTGETVAGDWAVNEDENWEMTLMQAWGKVDLPFAPVSLKIGRQPLLFGNGLYLNTGISKTFAIVADACLPFAKVSVGTAKLYEGVREADDDADINFVTVNKAVGPHNLGLFVAHEKDISSSEAAPAPAIVDSLERTTTNIGLTGKGKIGPLTYKAEFDYMVGKDKSTKTVNPTDVDIAGYAFMAGVGLPPLSIFKLGLEVGLGSGDDVDTKDKNEAYIPPGPFYPYAWAYEYRFIHWIWNSSRFGKGTVGVREALAPGLENTTYLKASARWKLNKWLSGAEQFIYLMATEPKPIKDNTGASFDPGKNIGIEIDTIVNCLINKHFSYQFIFAYVLPGNFFDGRIKGFDAANKPIEADNAWGIRSQFAFTF